MSTKVAVVTGSNKGIGLAIVRGLCKQLDGVVYLTARRADLAKQAIEKLNEEGLNPSFHQLDIDNQESINQFAEYLKKKHDGIDILINNAAIAIKDEEGVPLVDPISAEKTIKTNYFSTLNVCYSLFPLLKSHARVVNVSSRLGLLNVIPSLEIREKLIAKDATIEEINQIMTKFIDAAKNNNYESQGFPNNAYGVSKVGLNALTMIQQRVIDNDTTRTDIIINSCSPGYVATDMTRYKGHLTVEQGAETPIYLALLPIASKNTPRGQFLCEKQIVDWTSS